MHTVIFTIIVQKNTKINCDDVVITEGCYFGLLSMSSLRCLLGTSSVLGRGRLVEGLAMRPLLNQPVMAERS